MLHIENMYYYWVEVIKHDNGDFQEKVLGRSNDLDIAVGIAKTISQREQIEILVLEDQDHEVMHVFKNGVSDQEPGPAPSPL